MPRTASTRPAPSAKAESGAARLTRDDWLDAGFLAAVEGGLGAVRVLVLARALGVTRGSFYWHFSDHAELIAALIARWHRSELAALAASQAPNGLDPVARLLAVLDQTIALTELDRQNDRFEQALRSHAGKDAALAQLLEAVDRSRLQMLHAHYVRLTGDDDAALELSALLYLAIVGSHQALNRPAADVKMANYLKSIIAKRLVHALEKCPEGSEIS
jgi:AcrR family transcriptional regulator